jgi:hypothetical protein
MAINHVKHRLAHGPLFRLKVIEDENQQITQQANQGRFTTPTLSTIAGITGTVGRVSAQFTQRSDAGKQLRMPKIKLSIAGIQTCRQILPGQIIDQPSL